MPPESVSEKDEKSQDTAKHSKVQVRRSNKGECAWHCKRRPRLRFKSQDAAPFGQMIGFADAIKQSLLLVHATKTFPVKPWSIFNHIIQCIVFCTRMQKYWKNNSAGICFSVDFKSKKHQKAAPIQLASSYYDAELVPSCSIAFNVSVETCFSLFRIRSSVGLCVVYVCVCVQYTRV